LPVDVELFGNLASSAKRRQTVVLERPMTVREVAHWLGLDMEMVGLISIDGVQKNMEDLVPADCRLCFFPPLSGG